MAISVQSARLSLARISSRARAQRDQPAGPRDLLCHPEPTTATIKPTEVSDGT